MQDQNTQKIQNKSVRIVTQFQEDNSNKILVTDLYIFNRLKISETFTTNIKQYLQRMES
jgi:hypothetical protein